jgi:hypothetical protein
MLKTAVDIDGQVLLKLEFHCPSSIWTFTGSCRLRTEGVEIGDEDNKAIEMPSAGTLTPPHEYIIPYLDRVDPLSLRSPAGFPIDEDSWDLWSLFAVGLCSSMPIIFSFSDLDMLGT